MRSKADARRPVGWWQHRRGEARSAGAGALDRSETLDRLGSERFDVVVVGGGITGAGAALDAAARGLRTALVEARDFASGTSSRSSKLVHGGLRYVSQHEIGLVYEALNERQHLLRNAPHLVRPLPFLIPLFGSDGVRDRTVSRAYGGALWAYDLTGGLRIGHRHRRVDADALARDFPALRREQVVAGFVYWDAHADDARLCLEVVRTAVAGFGVVACNWARVVALTKRGGGAIDGVRIVAELPGRPGTGVEIGVRAGAVINATGVWADHFQTLEGPGREEGRIRLRPAKGVHVTVPASRLPARVASVLPVPGEKRTIFVVPWGDHTYLGTTDTDYQGDLDEPRCDAEDVSYLLDTANAATTAALTSGDVSGVWAGLRPLIDEARRRPGLRGAGPGAIASYRRLGSLRRAQHRSVGALAGAGGQTGTRAVVNAPKTSDLSRRHRVTTSPGGLVTVTGGKLTTYRRMAADAVDAAGEVLGRRLPPSATGTLRLLGANAAGREAVVDESAGPPLPVGSLEHLTGRYGSETPLVLDLIRARPELAEPLVPGLPYLAAEAVYAVRYEMAHALDDVCSRRTRARLRDIRATEAALPRVAELIGRELGWDARTAADQVATLAKELANERRAAGLPDRQAVGGSGGWPPPAAPGAHR